ncbi:MAG: DUF2298 domain-containing protein [Anaerolineae bacterium]|nr:DUF2298 domain-containing protein [Anaerolineae bacterium]
MIFENVFLPAFLWYLAVSLVGVVTLPISYRILSALPGRGYAFGRTAGLLLWAYIFWLLSSLGVLHNDLGGIFFALLVLAGLSVWTLLQIPAGEFWSWCKENKKLIISVEILFALALFGYAFFRALSPELVATEKPMELAFINALLRSPGMPPHDPWLADYAISYYYFGYVIVSMLAKVSGVNAGTAFNLGVTLVFSLTAVGAYGIVYDLLAVRRKQPAGLNRGLALFGPLYVLIVSNVEGLFELLYSYRILWHKTAEGILVSPFFQWLGIKSLVDAPNPTAALGERRFWWWWRASRVVQDYHLVKDENGLPIFQEVIDEFPFFSFYLADLHPHVLVMPFVMLAVALALALYLKRGQGRIRLGWVDFDLNAETFLSAALVFGGLAFLNIWDFPLYVGLFALTYAVKTALQRGWSLDRLVEFMVLGVSLGLAGAGLYLPFYLGFSSQAGGILPNLYNPTRGAHLWVMFGTLFIPLFLYLVYTVKEYPGKVWQRGIGASVAVSAALTLLALLLAWGISLRPEGQSLLNSLGAASLGPVLAASAARRASYIGGWVTLTLLLGLAIGALWPRPDQDQNGGRGDFKFPFILILFGSLLVLVPEFVYLKDLFGTRMNTIFKFYIQAWMVWGLGAAYASALLLSETNRAWRRTAVILLTLGLAVGLVYPTMGAADQVGNYQGNPGKTLTLDGTDHYYYLDSDDFLAAEWLRQAPLGTLVEAVGGSYSGFGRISAHTGQPALLGWPGHESQWRGGGEEMGSRYSDVGRLYTTGSWREAQQIIRDYHIRYIYVGSLERRTYDLRESKFQEFLILVFQQGGVSIYEVPQGILSSEDQLNP